MLFLWLLCATIVSATINTTELNTENKTNEDEGKFKPRFHGGRGFLIPGRRPWFPSGEQYNDSDAIVIENTDHNGNGTPSQPHIVPILPPTECPKTKSCIGRCTNIREFQNVTGKRNDPACFCDPQCNSVFHDCCADYEKYCNSREFQEKISKDDLDSRWKCFEMEDFSLDIWMIGSCKAKWSDDEIAFKCTNISKELRKVSILTPVIDKENITYRNRYCAHCNHVQDFAPWKFSGVKCTSVPSNDPKQETQFFDEKCDAKTINFSPNTIAIRYCFKVHKDCKYNYNQSTVESCKKARTGLVRVDNETYRNFDCLLCNQKPRLGFFPLQTFCAPEINASRDRIVSFGNIFVVSLGSQNTARCSPGYFYDNAVHYCRKLLILGKMNLKNQLRKYFIRLRYERKWNNIVPGNNSDSTIDKNIVANQIKLQFRAAFKKKIEVSLKNTSWQFSDLNIRISKDTNSLVTFQILEIHNVNTSNSNSPLKSLGIDKIYVQMYLNSTKTYSVFKYSLVENITREMTCLDEAMPKFVSKMQEQYRTGEYLMYKHQNETKIAVCKDFRPANCSYYLDVKNSSHWKLFPNRSIYSNVTTSWFHYGEYSVINGTLWLCLTKDFLKNTNKIRSGSTSVHNVILSYTTLASLTISIISLVVLLIVYSLLPSLRNLPGKNLMLFCTVLALGQLLWLIQEEVHWSSTLCVTMSIALQYLFLSSFSCSGSIALHSFLTFHGIAMGKLRQPTDNKAVLRYALYGLGFPFILVTIFWLVDFYGVISIQYGGGGYGHCWLGNIRGLYIAFFGPMFTLLFLNFILLLATIRVIHRCTKASQKLSESNGPPNKKHVLIYLRMSTVMGFTWLFGLFQLIFPEFVAFEYLFVIINGLQGFYVAVAFLFTDNVRKTISKKVGGHVSSAQNTTK